MRLSAAEYRKRLREYSDGTIRLIARAHELDKENNAKARDITTDSELTEEQVVERLAKLLAAAQQKKDENPNDL